MNKNIIVTGPFGQVGSYACEMLLDRGYNVIGVARRSDRNTENCGFLEFPRYIHEECDIVDSSGIRSLIKKYKPLIYWNTAAVSHVHQSFREPIMTLKVNGEAVVNALEAIRCESPETRFIQCSTSEMFGHSSMSERYEQGVIPKSHFIQDEHTQFDPRSPYAASKVYAHHMVKMYRTAYKLFACSAICFNHESPRRGKDFVTKKITSGIAAIKLGLQNKIRLGNLDAYRDFGYAPDYVNAQYRIVTAAKPDDYVVATGKTVQIKEILKYTCELAGLDWNDVYEIDEKFMRPSDVEYLCGDSSKIFNELGWRPVYDWQDIIKEMYEYDLYRLRCINRCEEKKTAKT